MGDLAERYGDAEPDSPEMVELRQANRRLKRQLARAKAKTADLIDAVYEAARDAAVSAPKPRKPAKDRRKRSGEIALLHTTDWQVGKETISYSTDVAVERLGTAMLAKAEKITEIQRADHPVRHLHVLFGGDMVEGVNIFPGQPFEVDSTLYDQLFAAATIGTGIVSWGLDNFETVTVHEEWGNHGRLGRRGDYPGHDNIDLFLYRIVEERFGGQDRLDWQRSESWWSPVETGNYKALLVHGDEIRSFGGNVPAYGILRKVNSWAAGAIDFPFADAYLGHFHTPMTLTLANGGRVFVTGSPESDNEYAREFVAAASAPSQRLHFVDPDAGRVTSEHLLWLE